jgi:hypothetical protein
LAPDLPDPGSFQVWKSRHPPGFSFVGFAVAEVNLVRPFDRPAKNWIWEFNLQQGF